MLLLGLAAMGVLAEPPSAGEVGVVVEACWECCSFFLFSFLSLARLFWNQIFTWSGQTHIGMRNNNNKKSTDRKWMSVIIYDLSIYASLRSVIFSECLQLRIYIILSLNLFGFSLAIFFFPRNALLHSLWSTAVFFYKRKVRAENHEVICESVKRVTVPV